MQVTNSMAMFFNKQEDEENEDEEDEVFDSVHHTRIYDIFSFFIVLKHGELELGLTSSKLPLI